MVLWTLITGSVVGSIPAGGGFPANVWARWQSNTVRNLDSFWFVTVTWSRKHTKGRGSRSADHTSPLTGWMNFHLCLRTSRTKTSSRLAGPGPQWAVATSESHWFDWLRTSTESKFYNYGTNSCHLTSQGSDIQEKWTNQNWVHASWSDNSCGQGQRDGQSWHCGNGTLWF